MYQRFNKRVEAVVKLANEIAREYDLDYVGTEHVLLAIRREGGNLGSKLLEKRGISEAKIKAEVDRLIKKGLEDTWVFGRLPGTPHFRNVVARAIEMADKLKSPKIEGEHLLLALLQEEGSVAHQALEALGCRFRDIHAEVIAHAEPQAETMSDE